MQTEEKRNQAKPERHWHLVHLEDGEPSGHKLVVRGTPKEVTETIRTALIVAYRQSKKELKGLAGGPIPDVSLLGQAYLRHAYLDKLTDMLDHALFDHALFQEGTNMDSLVEAIEDTLDSLDSLGTVEVTEQVSMKIFFCDDQCPELTEYQEAEKDHSKHGHAFVLKGLEELLKEAGIQVAKTEADHASEATTEAYLKADRTHLEDLFNHADAPTTE